MSKLLLINLKRFGDIYASSQTIRSLKEQRPELQISLLVYKEFEVAAKNLKDVDQVLTIDRKRISSILKNKIYSNAYALTEIKNVIDDINAERFTEVFNYSNDPVGTNITSYLKATEEVQCHGVTVGPNRQVDYSNDYSLLFNDVLTEINNSPLNFQDCYKRMVEADETESYDGVALSEDHNQSADKNFDFIRNANPGKKIVGIQIKTSMEEKDISYIILRDYIALLKESERLFPVLLIGPFEEERILAQKLNMEFGGSLVIAEADLQAVASVLRNCDLLVGPDTVIKHIADNVGTKVLEVSIGPSPFFKQGPYRPNQLVMTDVINQRPFTLEETRNTRLASRINSQSIFSATEYALFGEDLNISAGISLYQTFKDEMGTRYKVVGGDISWNHEINRLIMREWIAQNMGDTSLASVYEELETIPNKEIKSWIARNKDLISHIMRELLSTLRALAKIKNGEQNSIAFINALDKLLSRCEVREAIVIPVLIFRARVENINQTDLISSTVKFESLLFKLKTDLTQYLDLITKVEAGISPQRKSTSDTALRSNPEVSA